MIPLSEKSDSKSNTQNSLVLQPVLRAEHFQKIFNMIPNVYTDSIGATIREYTANAIDSHREAGQTLPVIVKAPTALDPTLSIIDKGIGMSFYDLCTTFISYGHSTKDKNNNAVGGFGIGTKVAYSQWDLFIYETVKDGRKNILQASKENGIYKFTFPLLEENEVQELFNRNSIKNGSENVLQNTEEIANVGIPTNEPNGVTVKIPVTDISPFDVLKFRKVLEGFSEKEVEVKNIDKFFRIPDSYIEFENGYIHPSFFEKEEPLKINTQAINKIVIGGIAYPAIDRQTLDKFYNYLCVKIPIGSVKFPVNREIIENDSNKVNITAYYKAENELIKEASQYATKKYQELIKRKDYLGYHDLIHSPSFKHIPESEKTKSVLVEYDNRERKYPTIDSYVCHPAKGYYHYKTKLLLGVNNDTKYSVSKKTKVFIINNYPLTEDNFTEEEFVKFRRFFNRYNKLLPQRIIENPIEKDFIFFNVPKNSSKESIFLYKMARKVIDYNEAKEKLDIEEKLLRENRKKQKKIVSTNENKDEKIAKTNIKIFSVLKRDSIILTVEQFKNDYLKNNDFLYAFGYSHELINTYKSYSNNKRYYYMHNEEFKYFIPKLVVLPKTTHKKILKYLGINPEESTTKDFIQYYQKAILIKKEIVTNLLTKKKLYKIEDAYPEGVNKFLDTEKPEPKELEIIYKSYYYKEISKSNLENIRQIIRINSTDSTKTLETIDTIIKTLDNYSYFIKILMNIKEESNKNILNYLMEEYPIETKKFLNGTYQKELEKNNFYLLQNDKELESTLYSLSSIVNYGKGKFIEEIVKDLATIKL